MTSEIGIWRRPSAEVANSDAPWVPEVVSPASTTYTTAGADRQAGIRDRLAQAWIELEILRLNILRSLSGVDGPVAPPEASIAKLYWASWHRRLGELAMDVFGAAGQVTPGGGGDGDLDEWQRTFLFSRSETIYGGSNQIQRNVIGERVLGLPRDPKGTSR